MLPACRKEGDLYPIPVCGIETPDVEACVEELKTFHEKFADCFVRSEPREHFYHYMVGQLSQLERKSIEPIAVNVSGKERVRSMQHVVSGAVWDESKMVATHQDMVAEEMGEPDGVLLFDESGFVKKGSMSAGVARQYCGTIGKVENCQVGVFMGYASRQGYALVDSRLFFPEQWFDKTFAVKRQKCGVPEELRFKTKPQLAADMLLKCSQQGRLPFKYIAADSLYGNSLDFIEAAEHCIGKTYFVSMPADTQCWTRRPVTETKTYRYQGDVRSKQLLKAPKKAPITVEQFANEQHACRWFRRSVSEGTKGPIEYEFTRRRVTLAKDGLPWKTVWLVVKRSLDDEPRYWYYVSNAPRSSRLSLFVWLSGVRWAIEQCFEETKGELGMDHYEVRKYVGWYHHMLTCLLAHFFCGISSSRWQNEPRVSPCRN
jgi:SRSO17 transposase